MAALHPFRLFQLQQLFLRSYFCLVYTDGTPIGANADISRALAPGFWI